MTFAAGKNAYGICDITGFRYKLKDMRKTWNGLLVGPDQWSAKEPQIKPNPIQADPEAVRDARIDPSSDGNDGNFFMVYTNVDKGILGTQLTSFAITSSVGNVEVTIT
jgi:hypothetical protein|tara:strand:- start:2044 stop:2367 length:324 start_codon:yes stop_codon:yes gene_type:complete